MYLNRRQLLAASAGTAVSTWAGAARASAGVSITEKKLTQTAARPVLKRAAFTSPVIIESVECLRRGRDEFVRVRSKDGAEGVSITNSRGGYLFPILKQLIVPCFLGKDARDLETHLWEV